jgi:hypothetical protein
MFPRRQDSEPASIFDEAIFLARDPIKRQCSYATATRNSMQLAGKMLIKIDNLMVYYRNPAPAASFLRR